MSVSLEQKTSTASLLGELEKIHATGGLTYQIWADFVSRVYQLDPNYDIEPLFLFYDPAWEEERRAHIAAVKAKKNAG